MVLNLLDEILESEPWRLEALCVGESEHFLSRDGQGMESDDKYQTALPICCRCPVRMECLHYALAETGEAGRELHVYGGWPPGDRKRILRPAWLRRGKRLAPEWVDELWRRRMSERWGATWVAENPLLPPDWDMGVQVQKPTPKGQA